VENDTAKMTAKMGPRPAKTVVIQLVEKGMAISGAFAASHV
jgi:hypothetical protein